MKEAGVGGEEIKKATTEKRLSAFTQAMAGAFAGGISRVTVAPLDVIKIRMQVQVERVGGGGGGGMVGGSGGASAAAAAAASGGGGGGLGVGKYRGILQCATTILREEGARGLWAGTVPALFLWVPYTAIQFAALGEFRRYAERAGSDPESPPIAFAGGAVVGAHALISLFSVSCPLLHPTTAFARPTSSPHAIQLLEDMPQLTHPTTRVWWTQLVERVFR